MAIFTPEQEKKAETIANEWGGKILLASDDEERLCRYLLTRNKKGDYRILRLFVLGGEVVVSVDCDDLTEDNLPSAYFMLYVEGKGKRA